MKHTLAFPRQIDTRTLDRLALLASLVLVIVLGYTLAQLTWTVLGDDTAPPAVNSAQAAVAAPDQAPDYGRLAALHLFGQASREASRPAVPIDAPETTLKLTLRGILFNPLAEQARAIVEIPGKGEENFRVGSELPGGAIIDQIYADRVMLLRNGRYETLRLPEDRLDTPVDRVDTAAAMQNSAAGQLASGEIEALAEYRRQLVENPQDAGQFIQAQPVNRGNGQIAGFRVTPGADARMFELAGLQAGDIVTSINGVQIDSMDQGFQAMEALATADSITLMIQRNGREQTVRLNLRN